MKKYLQKKLNNEKGMTLIELLAVIVIIAIIAAIAIPAIGNIIENSRVGAVKSDTLNVMAAAQLYYTENSGAAGPVAVSLLVTPAAGGASYLDDAASFTGTTTSVTKDGKITGKGTVGTISIDFEGANKAKVNNIPNSAPNGVVTTTTGVGTATIAGR